MQKRIFLASAIGVIPSYFTLFMMLNGFTGFAFPAQIMLSLMMSSSVVIACIWLVFVLDYFRCKKHITLKSYEMFSVCYLSSLFCFLADYHINGIPWGFLSGPILVAFPRFIKLFWFNIKANHRDNERKIKQDYIDNDEYPKEE